MALTGNFGLSTNDQIRMIERTKREIPKGATIYYVTYVGYSPALDKVVERSTLDTTDKAKAKARYAELKANPHVKNVRFNTGVMR